MVFPILETVTDEDGVVIRHLPRQRIHHQIETLDCYEVFLNAAPNHVLRRSLLSKEIFNKFRGVKKIFHVSITKIKIIFDSADNANILLNSDWKSIYIMTIPFNSIEIRGRVPIQSDLTEEYIFNNLQIYQQNNQINPLVLEVRRIPIRNKDPKKDKSENSETVIIIFSGTTLPKNIVLDHLIIPVYPHIERILQCRKCWSFGHSTNSCRGRNRCITFGITSIHETCDEIPCCVNCKGPHKANSQVCPFLLKEKTNSTKPHLNLMMLNAFSLFSNLVRTIILF